MVRWLVAAALLLAGCSGPSEKTSGAEPAGDAAAPTLQTESLAWDAATMGSYCAWTEPVQEGCFGVHEFPQKADQELTLPANTTSANFTFTWSAPDLRTETLWVGVYRGGMLAQEATGTSPLAVDLQDLSPGSVTLLAYPPRTGGQPAQAHDAQPYSVQGTIQFLA